MDYVLITLAMVGFIVAVLVLLARSYPGSGADLLDWKPTRDYETEFKLEQDDSFRESVWLITQTIHKQADSAYAGIRSEQDQAIAGSQQSEKKQEPIRNRSAKVGRNDPCPCGSGKKYKNCCMRMGVR